MMAEALTNRCCSPEFEGQLGTGFVKPGTARFGSAVREVKWPPIDTMEKHCHAWAKPKEWSATRSRTWPKLLMGRSGSPPIAASQDLTEQPLLITPRRRTA